MGYLAELREGARILGGREFWRAFAAYWHPAAVVNRVERALRR